MALLLTDSLNRDPKRCMIDQDLLSKLLSLPLKDYPTHLCRDRIQGAFTWLSSCKHWTDVSCCKCPPVSVPVMESLLERKYIVASSTGVEVRERTHKSLRFQLLLLHKFSPSMLNGFVARLRMSRWGYSQEYFSLVSSQKLWPKLQNCCCSFLACSRL